jgi:hypothetical protein
MNLCQKTPFLPLSYGHKHDIADSITAKILFAFKSSGHLGLAAEHAVSQLLLRLPYLMFYGDIMDNSDPISLCRPQDFELNPDLQTAIHKVNVLGEVYHGTAPMLDIFDRPIYGLWIPIKTMSREGSCDANNFSGPSSSACGKIYTNALQAVQEVSFGSHKYRHDDCKFDEIQMANTIVLCADAVQFEHTESYNHTWRWLDTQDIVFTKNDDRSILNTSNRQLNHSLPSNILWSTWDVGYKNMVSNLCGNNDTSV